MWTAKRLGRVVDYPKELADVEKCQDLLQQCETRCVHQSLFSLESIIHNHYRIHFAGMFRFGLYTLELP